MDRTQIIGLIYHLLEDIHRFVLERSDFFSLETYVTLYLVRSIFKQQNEEVPPETRLIVGRDLLRYSGRTKMEMNKEGDKKERSEGGRKTKIKEPS